MTHEFEDYVTAVRAQSEEVAALVVPLTDAALNRRPRPGSWSAGECIVHMTLTIPPYLAAIDAAVAEARARGRAGAAPWRGTLMGRLFISALEPPPRMRVPTLKYLVPVAVPDRERLVAGFRDAQDAVVAARERASGVDLGHARVTSPFFSVLRTSADESFRILLAHNRRHLWQARRALERAGVAPGPAPH